MPFHVTAKANSANSLLGKYAFDVVQFCKSKKNTTVCPYNGQAAVTAYYSCELLMQLSFLRFPGIFLTGCVCVGGGGSGRGRAGLIGAPW